MKSVDFGNGFHVVIGGEFPLCNTPVILSDEVTVIDPGCRLEDLRAFLKSHSIDFNEIDNVVLSHIHPDHITHAARIQRLAKAKIIANEITAPCFNDKEEMKMLLGFHPKQKVRPFWEQLVNDRMYGALDDGSVDIVLQDRETLTLGNVVMRTLYTPGHLPDHMCLEFPEIGYVFGADIDCTDFGPFYGHPSSSIPLFKESIQMLRDMEFKGLISGHLADPLVEDYKGALKSYELQIDMRDDFVLMAISGGAGTIDEITMTPIIYRSLSNLVFLQFEKWMIEHHVNSLVVEKLVAVEDDRYIAKQTPSS
ncbi:MAG: MBL fold metallo-hydrolase [Candidatus Thorarchaeota archaeon]